MKKHFIVFALTLFTLLSLCSCSSIKLETSTMELKVGECVQITPETADTPITYESSDSTIATVDENGLITGIDVGSATITAKNSKGKAVEWSILIVKRKVKAVVKGSMRVY